MALIDKETICAEIERLKDTAWRRADNRYGREDANTYEAWAGAYEKVLEILGTIPEQPVEELEEAAEKWCKENGRGFVLRDKAAFYIGETLPAFKAGAEWQKAKDQKTIELAEDHAMLAGMNKMEQQMMEKAAEKYVHELYTDEEGYHCYISLGTEYAPGDKVRVIVINKDDK